MILDTSALMAVLFKEPGYITYAQAMAAPGGVLVSAATLIEATMVVTGRDGQEGADDLERLLIEIGAQVVPVTERDARAAIGGWRRFGKGRHKAGLNFGDCFAYALARERGDTLLFKGDDFSQTDVKAAI